MGGVVGQIKTLESFCSSLITRIKTINNDDLLTFAKENENVAIHLKDKDIIKEIVVPQRLVNFVVK